MDICDLDLAGGIFFEFSSTKTTRQAGHPIQPDQIWGLSLRRARPHSAFSYLASLNIWLDRLARVGKEPRQAYQRVASHIPSSI